MSSYQRSARPWLLLGLALVSLAACRAHTPSIEQELRATLDVLSYNIRHGVGTDGALDLERTAEVLRASGADLVALQEVDRGARRSGTVDQPQELARLTGLHPAFAPFMDFQGGEYGLAILSRFPIERSWSIALPPGEREPRAALAVEVQVPGLGPLTFVSLHLDWLADDERRLAQAQALLAALESQATPLVLAGDFNDLPESATLALFAARFANAPKPDGAGWTFPAPEPEREIDYVMSRPATALLGTSLVLEEPVASDHRPLLAEFPLQ